MRALHTALSNMRRSPYQALTASIMMTLTFFVVYCFVIVLIGSHVALRYLETRPQVTAFFATSTSPETVQSVATTMQGKPYVSGVKIVSNQDALKLFQEQNQKDPLLLELVTADILPASIEVSAKEIANLGQIRDDLTAIEGVDEVIYQKDVIDNLSAWTQNIRLAGISVSGVLLIVTVLFVFVILSLRVAMKRGEIGIMRLLGAGGWFIRGPFVVEGLLYGVIGAMVGWVMMITLVLYLTPSVVKFFGPALALPFPAYMIAGLLGGGLLVGGMLGTFASILAVKRLSKS